MKKENIFFDIIIEEDFFKVVFIDLNNFFFLSKVCVVCNLIKLEEIYFYSFCDFRF